MNPDNTYNGKRVLITGGLGFIGSNLAIRLAGLGASVTIVDVLWPEHGGNMFSIEPVKDAVDVNICDIRDKHAMGILTRDKDIVFHLAGQCSHVLGRVDPFPDIDINTRGTVTVLECVRSNSPAAVTVFSSTRGVYGSVRDLPASEESPTDPKGLYELSNLTAEKIIDFYADAHGIKAVNLRLSNIYGERAQMMHDKFGVANWFVRLAMDGRTIRLFGDGQIKRDFLYIDDCVDCLLAVAVNEETYGKTLNVGNDRYCTFKELVENVIEAAGSGDWEFVPFTQERAAQEPGDFYPDITRMRECTGWQPQTSLKDGLAKTVDFYRRYGSEYW